MLKATVSGSFHRHMQAISRAVDELIELGVKVLSPSDPRVVDHTGEFLFVASDRVRSIRLVEDRHLESIRQSDFVWLVAPDGYVGQSASMEVGYAVAHDIPILSLCMPSDLTLRRYVQQVFNLKSVVDFIETNMRPNASRETHFLIDPHASIDAAHNNLEQISQILRRKPHEIRDTTTGQIYTHLDSVRTLVTAPRRKISSIT